MPNIYIVRHGQVAPDPLDEDNPELSDEGKAQARAVAQELDRRLPARIPVVTSPLRRCLQTAAPLCELWETRAALEPRIAEIPRPPSTVMARSEWVRHSLEAEWTQFMQLAGSLREGFAAVVGEWRTGVMQAVMDLKTDTLIFSHFVPINVLTGRSIGSERVACFQPDHTSISVFETSGGRIRLIEQGREKQRLP